LAKGKGGPIDADSAPIRLARNTLADKHILRIKKVLDTFDPQKLIYPNGVLGELEEDDSSSKQGTIKRIELFAENKTSMETFGVIRNFFMGFSSDRELLDLANFSNSVISVRAIGASRENSETKLLEDKLVLKRIEPPAHSSEDDRFSISRIYSRQRLSSLIVSSRWLDRMGFCKGDRIMISNPVENYVTPPPQLGGNN
jgi:hypothetical protein